ncbi:transporter substrate-binding domain-containing protein [Dickeya sp. CFBP 2040]|uniref:transporter substrate-binding domain-containing protein n=1 Tax=Dickeya sp. CFBP 2040 TaxID=2718531 RepID=UPI001447B059|nr:transporter substrate-binding domain-containing protein [Dickeya sp. CFBP 2040]NKI76301.1 transporter substrate-binding domain-containing protein [Dickeya sp. CFBP 2040]
MFRKLYILPIIIIFTISPLAFAHQGVIRIGVDLTFSPFQSRDINGNPAGFEIDITDAICKSVNAKCDYIVNTFDSQIPALLAKKIDVISPLAVTRKRKEAIDFSNYVFHIPTRLVARKTATFLPQADMLRGKNIGVQQGTIQETYANKYWLPAGVNVKSYPDQEAIYEDLYAGRLDGALCPSVSITFGFLQTPEGKDFELKGPEVTDANLFSIGSAYGIRKGDTETKQLFNQGLQNIINNGTFARIKKRYFGDIDLSVKE